MKARFQADADLNAEIVAGVLRREPSIDFHTADEAKLRRFPDPEVLAVAAQENRILVTHDRRTMPSTVWRKVISCLRCYWIRDQRTSRIGPLERFGHGLVEIVNKG